MRLAVALLLITFIVAGCVSAPSPASPPVAPAIEPLQPAPEPPKPVIEAPEPVSPPVALPKYDSVAFGKVQELGDFNVTIVSVGRFTYKSPFGEELTDQRVDFKVRNNVGSAREFRFGYRLLNDGNEYPMRWYSTVDTQGLLAAGEASEGYALYNIGGAEGPFQVQVRAYSVTENDYVNVVGESTLDNPVAGAVNYANACGGSALGEAYLGALLSEGCGRVSAARDLAIYPVWVEDGVVITRLKLKNHGEKAASFLVVDEVPEKWGSARELAYSKEPVFLDDNHVAWLVRLGRNEIWLADVNYTKFIQQTQVESLPSPAVLPVDYSP